MASRFTLPHIEITRFRQQHEYASSGSGGNPVDRIRTEHGRRLQGELDAALKLAEELRPKDERLPAATTSILEVELRRGTDPEKLDRVRDNIRSRSDRHSAEPGHGGGELNEACEVQGSAIIARCEAAEVLEPVEATFDAVAVFVDDGIVRDDDLAASV